MDMPELPPDSAPRIPLLWRTWLTIGVQSFGGGTVAFALIEREFVEHRRWITAGEFTSFWSLCQLTPGINLVAFAAIIGNRLAGWRGALTSVAGLILPSALIAMGLTFVYRQVENVPLVKAALSGILPATVGLGAYTAFQMLRTLWQENETVLRRRAAAVLVLITAGVAAYLRLPVFVILSMAGTLCALVEWLFTGRTNRGTP